MVSPTSVGPGSPPLDKKRTSSISSLKKDARAITKILPSQSVAGSPSLQTDHATSVSRLVSGGTGLMQQGGGLEQVPQQDLRE